MTRSQASELEWLAFRYVADEMSSEEREGFELRLGDDQLARDAVATMVELTQTLVAVDLSACELSSASVARASHAWWYPVAWMSLGALACCLLMVIVSPAFLRPTAGPGSAGKASGLALSPVTAELASAWWQARQESGIGAGFNESNGPSSQESANAGRELDETGLAEDEMSSGDDARVTDDDATNLLPPDWMMTAVEQLTTEASGQPTPE